MRSASEAVEMGNPIRVLQLASPSGLYGAEHWILALIKHLDAQKIQSLVVTIKDAPEDSCTICEVANELGLPAFILNASGRFNIFSAISQLRKLIQEQRIDIIHTHGYKTDLIGLMAARSTGCKIVITPHGWTKNPGLKLGLYELLDKILFMFCDTVVPLSQGLYKSIGWNPFVQKKIILIANGVDLSEVKAASDIPEKIKRLKKNGKLILGCIGRLVPGKGLNILMLAMAGSSALHWHLIIIGAGPQESDLKELAKELGVDERVDFLGFRHDRLAFLKGFDIFILPSLSEGTPRCVMEAMAARIPVIASDIEGCRNLICHGETGVLFPAGDPNALAAAIHSFVQSPAKREQIIDNAFLFIIKNFSATRMAIEYESLFERLITIRHSSCSPGCQ